MDSSLQDIIDDARAAVAASADPAALANAKARFLGKDGAVTQRMKALGKLSGEERSRVGKEQIGRAHV